jgi:hypothetical protein
MRRIEGQGGFATVLRKGDAERGSLLLLITSRGRFHCFLERRLTGSGTYQWDRVGPADSASSTDLHDFVARGARFDGDMWAIELDIPDAERFIAETTAQG